MKKHIYKQFILMRNGTKETPWNIYLIANMEWVGYGYTFAGCKADIDAGNFEEAQEKAEMYERLMRFWRKSL